MQTLTRQTQKKKAFLRENPVSLFQVKMDDRKFCKSSGAIQILLELEL